MLEVSEDIRQMPFDHPSYLLHWLEPGAYSPAIPALPPPLTSRSRTLTPQVTQRLLESPRARRLQVRRAQSGEAHPGLELEPVGGEVLLAIEPEILGADEPVVAVGAKRLVLLTAHEVDRLVHVFDDVEAVEHDLGVDVVHVPAQRLRVGLPHVHRERLDLRQVVHRELP